VSEEIFDTLVTRLIKKISAASVFLMWMDIFSKMTRCREEMCIMLKYYRIFVSENMACIFFAMEVL
jgi:hypothetical protein